MSVNSDERSKKDELKQLIPLSSLLITQLVSRVTLSGVYKWTSWWTFRRIWI